MNECYVEMMLDDTAIMVLDSAAKQALLPTADYISGDAIQNQYPPFDYGTLQNSRYIHSDNNNNAIIEHNTPYAYKMYKGTHFKFQTVNNRNARAEWYKEYEEQGRHYLKVERFYAGQVKRFSERYVE